MADPPVGDSADRHPLGNFIFSIFLHKNEKIRVILPRIGFENRFFTMVAAPSDKPPPLTDFLDPPLIEEYVHDTNTPTTVTTEQQVQKRRQEKEKK